MTAKVYAVAQSVPELKPCPFCGGEAYLNRPHDGTTPFVLCKGCYSAGKQADQADAITAWNTRIEGEEPAAEAPADATISVLSDGLVAEIRGAIKATEYKYFGDYELSEEQQNAVAVLVSAAEMLLARAALEGVKE